MDKKITSLICVFLFLAFTGEAHAQKVEREKRISGEKFPAAAHRYLEDHFSGRSHQKLYLETGSIGQAYEAKFKAGHSKYSVKFDQNGQWLDTEKEVGEAGLLPSVKEKILDHLATGMDFRNVRLVRIQEQTSPNGLRYEIELKAKSGGKTALYEFLFDAGGSYLSHEEIIIESYINEF